MAEQLSTQLNTLQRERDRLEQLLMLDSNWRALRQLEEREAAGDPVRAVDGVGLRTSLTAALTGNRVYVAHARLLDTIALLAAPLSNVASPSGASNNASGLASRIILLSSPGSESFRARVRMKTTAPDDAPVLATVPPATLPEVSPPLPLVRPQTPSEPISPAQRRAVVPDALELIDGLRRPAVELLLAQGVRSFREISDWTAAEAAAWRDRLEGVADGEPGAWIEQAAVLCTGRETHHAARVRRGEFASLVVCPAPEPARIVIRHPLAETSIIDDTPVEHPPSGPLVVPVVVPITVPVTAPVAGTLSTAVPSPHASRLFSAADLVKVLAEASPQTQPMVPAPMTEPWSAQHSAGFARPVSPLRPDGSDDERDGESEVVVIERPSVASPALPIGASANPSSIPSRVSSRNGFAGLPGARLLRRLKQVEGEDRFSADGYAAYRSEVEEASVTIIRPQGAAAVTRALEVKSAVDAQQVTVNRFLKALTGKI